ncbi:MAG: hypothetical protein Q9222_007250 [Ikaeria aurantiellina]
MAPPPPATPNPRRFASVKHPKPQSPFLHPDSSSQIPQGSSSRQFASTPSLSFKTARQQPQSSSPVTRAALFSSSPLVPRPLRPVIRREQDEIDDGGSELYGKEGNIVRHPPNQKPIIGFHNESIEDSHSPPSSTKPPTQKASEIIEEDAEPSPLPSRKRRRLSISTSSPPSSPNGATSPQQNNTSIHSNPFILSPKRLSATSQPSHPTFLTSSSSPSQPLIPSRPPFVLPPRSLSPPPTALNALFSPQRRGQRFVSGGLAEMVRGWVVEVASTSAQMAGEAERIRVRDTGGGIGGRSLLVKGEEVDQGDEREWMLVGGDRGAEVRRGDLVSMSGPRWDVEMIGMRTWRVGVEWDVTADL